MSIGEMLTAAVACTWLWIAVVKGVRDPNKTKNRKKRIALRIPCATVTTVLYVLALLMDTEAACILFYAVLIVAGLAVAIQEFKFRRDYWRS